MAYISKETITGNGTDKTFTLANAFKAGTLLIEYNGKLFYEFSESTANDSQVVFDFAPLATDSVFVSYYTVNEPNVLNASRYLTVRQINSLSRVTDLTNDTDANNEKLIREVELYIDTIVGPWERYYNVFTAIEGNGQILRFPRVEDDVEGVSGATTQYPPIPKQITNAALYAAENLFLQGAPSSADLGEEQIESERLGDYSYKKTTKAAAANNARSMAINVVGSRAVAQLRGFMKRIGKVNIEDGNAGKRSVTLLNSRQRYISNN